MKRALPTEEEEMIRPTKSTRPTLEESKECLASLPTPPSSFDRVATRFKFMTTICKQHSHTNGVHYCSVPEEIFANPHMPMAGPGWLEEALASSGQGIKEEMIDTGGYKWLGRQQYDTFTEAIVMSAMARSVPDQWMQLACVHCGDKFKKDGSHLLTVATDRESTCYHPRILGSPTPWAIDPSSRRHPFESSPIYDLDGKAVIGRSGTAICVRCLWTHQLAPDADFMMSMVTWMDFEKFVYDNIYNPVASDTRRLCSCLYHPKSGDAPSGAICLFRFSYVVGGVPFTEGMFGHDQKYGLPTFVTNARMVRDHEANKRGYYTLDDPHLNDIVKEIMVASEQKRLAAISEASQAPPPPQDLEVEAPLHFDDPAAALSFIQKHKAVAQSYYEAVRTLATHHGTAIQIARPSTTMAPLYCRACGHFGHSGIKKCIFVIGNILERQDRGSKKKKPLTEHILENVTSFASDQRDSLLAMIDENKWEMSEIVKRVEEMTSRYAQNITATVIPGPNPSFVGSNPSSDQRRKSEAPRCTPLVPLKTLAGCSLDMITRGVNMDLFLDLKFLKALVVKLTEVDFDTTDVLHLIDWRNGLQPEEARCRTTAARSLHQFAKLRSVTGETSAPLTTARDILSEAPITFPTFSRDGEEFEGEEEEEEESAAPLRTAKMKKTAVRTPKRKRIVEEERTSITTTPVFDSNAPWVDVMSLMGQHYKL